jgi:hypothetical protein
VDLFRQLKRIMLDKLPESVLSPIFYSYAPGRFFGISLLLRTTSKDQDTCLTYSTACQPEVAAMTKNSKDLQQNRLLKKGFNILRFAASSFKA